MTGESHIEAAIATGGGGGQPVSLQARGETPSSTVLTTAVALVLSHQFANFDDASFLDIPTDATRFTIPVTVPVIQRVVLTFWGKMAQNATGIREVKLGLNGVFSASGAEHVANTIGDTVLQPTLTFTTGPIVVVPGDFFQFRAFQDSGGNLSLFRWNAQITSVK